MYKADSGCGSGCPACPCLAWPGLAWPGLAGRQEVLRSVSWFLGSALAKTSGWSLSHAEVGRGCGAELMAVK